MPVPLDKPLRELTNAIWNISMPLKTKYTQSNQIMICIIPSV